MLYVPNATVLIIILRITRRKTMSELFPDPNRQRTLDEVLDMADSKRKKLEGVGLSDALRTVVECVYYASQPRLTYGVDTMMRDVKKAIDDEN